MASIKDGYLVEATQMSAMADVSAARHMAIVLEDAEAKRLGIRVSKARPKVASALGTAPGTLENLRRRRLKSVPSWLLSRMRAQFIKLLQAELGRLEHEITVHLQVGIDPREGDLCAAQAQLAAAKEILSAATGGRTIGMHHNPSKQYRSA
jgi:hypothetical protein